MPKLIRIKKGLDIKLKGSAEKTIAALSPPDLYAIKPPDFAGVVPKLLVKEGEEVLAGSPLFFDKRNERVHFCSPVSGEVVSIVRGEKRRILEIKILADKQIKYVEFGAVDLSALSADDIKERLLKSGAWPCIRQRPYGIVAKPADVPKAIFISGFDSNPLAPDVDFVLQGKEADFQAGLNALAKLTTGKVHLNLHKTTLNPALTNANNVEITIFSGPHPSGNVGVQIHHINPVNKGDIIWTLQPQDVAMIGKLFTKGVLDASRIIAVTGPQVERPQYYNTFIGSSIKPILEDAGLKQGENRIISGNILSGNQLPADGFIDFYDTQLTVIAEGNEEEFMGWLAPGFNKFSISHTFFSWLNPNKVHQLNSNLHGEERPFVVTGEYEKVFPMDIYPVQLLKSILIEDVDLMEKLGIYEVVEEDFALCEVVCTSKIKSQEIIRHGIEVMRKEFG